MSQLWQHRHSPPLFATFNRELFSLSLVFLQNWDAPNEITAIPELLKVLEIAGCIVTIDAIGCQKEIVKLITQQSADYVITLKKNQGNLYESVEKLFKTGISTGFDGIEYSTYKTEETGHGRHEIRNYVMLTGIGSQLDPDAVWSKFIKIAHENLNFFDIKSIFILEINILSYIP